MKLYELESGLQALCWSCGKTFIKDNPCEKCEFYVCPHCNNCGCHLSECCRNVAKSVILTMELNDLLPIKKNKSNKSK